MEKIYALLSKQWDILYEVQSQNCKDSSNINECRIALDLGLIVLNSNLTVLNTNHLVKEQIINKYKQQFSIDINPSLDLTFDKLISPFEFDMIGSIYEEHIHNNGTRIMNLMDSASI